MHKENIDKKIQGRLEVQNKIMTKIISSTDNSKKEVLIDKGNSLPMNAIDYRKEREIVRNQVLENMRSKLNVNPGRKDVSDYYEIIKHLFDSFRFL